MTTHRGLLRYRAVRWPFYRLVSVRNYAFAIARWGKNHIAWLVRATWYRSLYIGNVLAFAARWVGLHIAWIARLVGNYLAWAVKLAFSYAAWLVRLLTGRTRAGSDRLRVRGALTVNATRARLAGSATVTATPVSDVVAPTVDALVVVHAHYPEVLPELLAAVRVLADAMPTAPELIITATPGCGPAAREALHRSGLAGEVVDVDNRGRDILPFLTLAQQGRLSHARLVLKLHTKVSPHRADGPAWRDAVVTGLTEPAVYWRLLARAKDGERFVAVPRDFVYGSRDWGKNVRLTARLAQQLGINKLPFRFRFAAGSIFWITGDLVARLAQLPLGADDFELEPLPLDGALPHALERLVGVVAAADGIGVLATEEA